MSFENAKQCTATSKRTGERCKNPAVTKWEVCRHHGAGGGRPVEHGLYAKQETKDLMFGDRAGELITADDLLDVKGYIAILRAMLEHFLERLAVTDRVGQADRDAVLKMVEAITKNIERLHRLEESAEASPVLNVFVDRVLSIGMKTITNPQERDAFKAELEANVNRAAGELVRRNGADACAVLDAKISAIVKRRESAVSRE